MFHLQQDMKEMKPNKRLNGTRATSIGEVLSNCLISFHFSPHCLPSSLQFPECSLINCSVICLIVSRLCVKDS